MTSHPGLVAYSGEQYLEYTKQVSGLVRSLGLAAFASAWLLAGALSDGAAGAVATLALLRDSQALTTVASAAVIALTLDFLQYVTATLTWGLWFWCAKILSAPGDNIVTDPIYRLAFHIGRLFGLVQVIEGDWLQSGEKAEGKDRERVAIFADRVRNGGQDAQPFSIQGANARVRLLPLLFFWAKCIALMVSYSALISFIL